MNSTIKINRLVVRAAAAGLVLCAPAAVAAPVIASTVPSVAQQGNTSTIDLPSCSGSGGSNGGCYYQLQVVPPPPDDDP